ncbi:ABC transporter ATP-binding protein [uncultured Cetobacterium sp.]|uniref:ABC transporter ATP-binding protein n=1 Tax=uncultured Cetobacterium sp. TaxID=527638 RepID=UPI0026368B3A|nr:ABC transporter ATP-binding protein [uncultured Cetobacterium sp.]
MKSLKVENLEYSYGKNKILKGVNLSLDSGELVGILGSNGCGKSTLLKTIMGFYKMDSGKVLIDEKNLKDISLGELSKKIAFITQSTNQNIEFNVLEFLRLGRIPHIKNPFKGLDVNDNNIVNQVIKDLNLENYLSRKVVNLSGGEFQRILLGKAFIQEGEIIFLDEPTSALDINHALDFLERLIFKIKESDLIGIIVIHDINLASLFCDKICFMKDGKITYIGKPKDIIKKDILEDIYGYSPEIIENANTKYILPKRSNDD